MADILSAHAAAQPDKLALIDDRPGSPVVTYTFREANERSNQYGALLVDLGVTSETKVVWCGQNSASALVVASAIRKVGAVGVPLNYRLTPEEAAYVVDNSDAEVVVVDAEYAHLIDGIRADTPKVREVLVFDGDGALEARLDRYPVDDVEPVAGVAGGTMIYTSGTTGKPKGAVRPGVQNAQQGIGLIALIGYQPDDIYITTGPLCHSGPGGFAAAAMRSATRSSSSTNSTRRTGCGSWTPTR